MHKILCLIVILSAASVSHGQSFTAIFASQGKVLVGTSDRLNEAKELDKFKRNVTGLAVYKDYLYVSVRRSSPITRDSAIWRVQLDTSKNIEIVGRTWQEFDPLNIFSENILCVVIANGFVYAGRTDGAIWRCSADEARRCDILSDRLASKVVGIDHNPADGRIYAALKSGSLLTCLPNAVNNTCQEIYRFKHEVTTVRVAFGTLWVGINFKEFSTGKVFGELWKCFESSAGFDCKSFQKFDSNSVVSRIDGTDKFLFLNVWGYTHMWFCDPYALAFCYRGWKIPRPPALETFIII